jgi:DNA uptake protein ComE-like DNA-binding protein
MAIVLTTARRWYLRRASCLVSVVLTVMAMLSVFASSPVRALAGDLEVIAKASNLDSDPKDFQAVAAVRTVLCHSAFQFLTTPRSSGRWMQVYRDMSGYGAKGTDEQLDRVVNHFQKNLMVINVNTSPPDDLGETLQVSDKAVTAIMARRSPSAFVSIDDLTEVDGVNRSIVAKLSAKKSLQF